ncbi:META domain protein [compost metagenome]
MVDPKRDIYLTFDEGKNKFGGSTGCNTIGGNLLVEGNKLILSSMIATKMACKNMRAEQLYLSLLESVDNYKLKGSRLILYQGDKEIASYRRSKEAAPPVAAN